LVSGTSSGLSRIMQVLHPEGVQQIHHATLKLLSEVGVVFQCEQAIDILKSHGAKRDGKVIRFPSRIVKQSIESAPAQVVLHARNKLRNVVLGGGNIHYTSCFGPVLVRKSGNKEAVPGTLDDLKRFTILSDALDNVSYCLFHVRPHEVPTGWHDVYSAATMLKLTGKHIHFSQDDASHTEILIALGETAADASETDGPVFSLGCCPTTPLVYDEDSCMKLLTAVGRGIPFLIVSGAMAGGTSPVTLAGTLVVQNAEVLAGIVLSQAIKPGAPVVYGSFSGGMEMSSGSFVMGGTELALMQGATAQLCRLYKIPFGYGSGGWTDACEPNIQAGFEKGCSLLAAALAGVEVIHSAHGGMLCGAQIADYAQMMIDDELCNMVNRYLYGIQVNDDTLALDIIRNAGPGGNFLESMHTARFFRNEHFLPTLLERSSYEKGFGELLENAAGQAEKVLATHTPDILDQTAVEEIDRIVARAVNGDI